MKRVLSLLPVASIFISTLAFAQMSLEGVNSGRYVVRKAKSRVPASVSEPIPVAANGEDMKVRTVKEPTSSISTSGSVDSSTSVATSTSAPIKTETPEVQEPSIGEHAESLVSSKMEKIYEFYREQVHPDDIRNNRAEIDVLPVVAYNDSQSNFSYRDYQSYFNGLQVKANVWFTPLLGVTGKFMFSLGADVDSMAADKSRVPVKYDFMDLGVTVRRFFGMSRKDPSVEISLLLSDNKFGTPSDNMARARLKSQGVGVAVKTRIPSSATYAWVFGGSFFPRLQHTENEVGQNLQSGLAGESLRLGVDLGGEWKFTRESQMIWSLSASSERNLFTGSAQVTDPSTGLTPSNVSVTNSLYMFSLGYRWGH